jgi:hypothetical protein
MFSRLRTLIHPHGDWDARETVRLRLSRQATTPAQAEEINQLFLRMK